MEKEEYEDYIKAGKIASEVKKYAKEIIKPKIPLLEIAQKIEKKIIELGGEVAFPVNLSINEIAAHYHPSLEDETLAKDLLKIDIGVHVEGFIADTAFSLDLTENNKHKSLIKASEKALENSINLIKKNPESTLNEIGSEIQTTITNMGFSPITNLSGHSLERYNLHAGITIPNYANSSDFYLGEGAYAIEPFATSGEGRIYEGPPSGIYILEEPKSPRSNLAREILEYIIINKKTLPFSLREIQEKFGKMSRLALRELEQNNSIHQYPQLIEKSKKPVSQAENTIIKNSDTIVTTDQH